MSEPPPIALQRKTYRVWFAVGVVVLVAVAVGLLYRPLAVLLAPILVALLVVYLLNPLVSRLERWGVPRFLGTMLVYFAIGTAVVVGGRLLGPLLGQQISNFLRDAPDLGATLAQRLGGLLASLGFDVDTSTLLDADELRERFADFVSEEENRGAVETGLTVLTGFARSAFALVVGLVVGPIVAFYLLVGLPGFIGLARRLVPPTHRTEVEHVAGQLSSVVGGFVRGQLLIAAFVGVAVSIALGAVGLPYWLIIGVIAGVTNLVPLLGPLVAGALGVTVALVSDGTGLALLVLVLMTAIQQLESSVVTPLVMGASVRVHPLAVLLGVIVAGTMWGVIGMFLVVPVVAAAKVLASHLWRTRVPWAVADPELDDPPGPDPVHGPQPPVEGAHVDSALGTVRDTDGAH
jgi:predicted PurR-regulated permease PerM